MRSNRLYRKPSVSLSNISSRVMEFLCNPTAKNARVEVHIHLVLVICVVKM